MPIVFADAVAAILVMGLHAQMRPARITLPRGQFALGAASLIPRPPQVMVLTPRHPAADWLEQAVVVALEPAV